MGGRGASGDLHDGPSGGGNNPEKKYGQPGTPQVPPTASIRGQIGEKGKPVQAGVAIKKVNPNINSKYADYSENCQRCVVAYELNRRGYKVEAESTYKSDPYPKGNNWTKAFKNAKLESVGAGTTAKVNEKITQKMKGWGEGSRGIVRVNYNKTSGHVFNVEYRNGKLHYYDAQVGIRYDPKKVFNHVVKSNVQIMRSDNLALNGDVTKMVRKRRK